jgi:hypothetical protein
VTQDFDGEAGGGSEAEEADSFAGFDPGYAQAAESDDAGAEQGRDVGVIEGGRQGEGEAGADEDVLGVASVDGVARKDGVVAEVFFAAEAVRADAVGSADPGDTDPRAVGKCRGAAFDDLADDLMAWDELAADGREIALDDVQVGAADSAGKHAEEDVSGDQPGAGDVLDG